MKTNSITISLNAQLQQIDDFSSDYGCHNSHGVCHTCHDGRFKLWHKKSLLLLPQKITTTYYLCKGDDYTWVFNWQLHCVAYTNDV